MHEWWSKIYSALQRRRGLDEDLSAEMRSHADLIADDFIAEGLTPEQSRAAAYRKFGNEMAIREQTREAWQFPGIESVLHDLRYGFRNIRRFPTFSLVVVLTLALGIGANTAIFSVVYTILLRTPPYPDGERLVEVTESISGQNIPLTWNNFLDLGHENRTFEDMAGIDTADLTLTGRGDATLTHAGVVSASFFHMTGWRPLIGRLFGEADDRPGAAPVILMTGEFWATRMSGDPHVIGSTLTLDGKDYQIIGILPPGLKFFTQPIDFYLPAGPKDGTVSNRAKYGTMTALGLLKPGVTLAAARADLDSIMKRLPVVDPVSENDHRTSVAWLAGLGTDGIQPILLVLMGAAGLVLVIACANVASLLLVRSTARAREIAVRSTIGAGPARLARQLLAENFVISAIGGAVGLLLAVPCVRVLVLMAPRNISRLWDAGLNLPVLSFTAALTVITTLLAGFAPISNASNVDLTAALKEGSPATGGSRQGHWLRNGLVVAEIAVTLVLTFGCGLLLRSLILAQTADPGFNAAQVLALGVQLPPSRYKSADAIRQFYVRLIQNLRREPGIESVGAVNCPPSTGGCAKGWYSIADIPAPSRADVPLTLLTTVDPAYFHTMGIRLLAGRGVTDADREGRPVAVVVNEKLARRWWPNAPQLAIGHPLKLGGPYMEGPTYEIVGVVANVKQVSLDVEPFAEIYVPFAQNVSPAMIIMIRTIADPARLIPAVRHQLASIDSNVPVVSLRPFEQWMGATLERRRFSTVLFGIFAALAVILSFVGIYGVLNYWVGARQKEIAIRVALGAGRPEILRWVGWNAIRLLAPGVALGLFGSLGAAQGLRSMLFGVSSRNPLMMLVAAVVVAAIGTFAASVPTLRATRVDPMRNLRDG